MNQREIERDKERIIDRILGCEEIVDLLKPDKPEGFIPEDLIGNGIYTYYRVPKLMEEAGTFITIVEEVPRLDYNNDVMKDKKITITIISHDDNMKVSGHRSNRNDIIGSLIDALFNKSDCLGVGYTDLYYSTEGILDTGHPFRSEVFAVQDFNSEKNRSDNW